MRPLKAGGHQPLESKQLTEEIKRLLMDPECDAEASTAPGKLTNKAHNRGLARRICCVKPLEAKKELNQTHQNSNHVTGRKQTESSKAEIVLDMVRQHTNRCACEFNGGFECFDQIPSVPKGASTFDFNLHWQQLLHATNPTALHGAFALVACVGPSGSSKRSALDRLCDNMCVAPTQDPRRGPGDAVPQGSLERGEGGWGRTMGGAPGMRAGPLWPHYGRDPLECREGG